MNYIAVDTSQEYLTVIVASEEKTIIKRENNRAFQHSVVMLDAVEKALDECCLEMANVGLFAVVVGPGSFTGIRIGIATAKGFAAPTNLKTLAITSFDTLAYAEGEGAYLAIIDAKHQNYYVCGYTDQKITLSPRFISKKELDEIVGYKFISATPIEGLKTAIVDPATGLLNAVKANIDKADDYDKLSPTYLRLSQAEEGRK